MHFMFYLLEVKSRCSWVYVRSFLVIGFLCDCHIRFVKLPLALKVEKG